jgi:hypothetical protein
MSYLARYEAGEHEAVWAELRTLAPAACNDNMMIEAKKVADATMRRVLSNLQRIDAGLRAAGYQFASAGSQPLDADAAVTAALRGADETLQGLGLLPGAAAQILKSIRQTLGKTPRFAARRGYDAGPACAGIGAWRYSPRTA